MVTNFAYASYLLCLLMLIKMKKVSILFITLFLSVLLLDSCKTRVDCPAYSKQFNYKNNRGV